MNWKIFALLAFVYVAGIYGFGRLQSVKVTGRLFCHKQVARDVYVVLEDYDRGPSTEDVIATGHTSQLGYFNLSGSHEELTTIDPRIRITHHCSNHPANIACNRTWVITVPDKYVVWGNISAVNKTFDLGTVNLEHVLDGESKGCFTAPTYLW